MLAVAAVGLGHDALALGDRHAQVQQAVAHHQVVAQPTLAVAHRPAQHRGHAQVALDPGRQAQVAALDLDPVDQVGQHGQLDAGLAQRRQDLLDVAQEQPVGPHHQDALALEGEAVGVEQVGGPVQRHHGLARARTPLHHQHAGHLGPDDLVLLALDGGDDVAELPRTRGLEGRHQGPVPGDGGVPVVEAEPRRGVAEQLVLDVEQRAAPGGEVATAGQAHRFAPGGPVEGLGHRSPPVDDHRLLVLVADRDAADVEGRGVVLAVDAPEAQRGVAQLELGEPLEHGVPDDVALEARLLGAAPTHLDHRGHAGGRLPRRLEAGVGPIDVGLLGIEIGMCCHGLLRGRPPRGMPDGEGPPRGTDHATGAGDPTCTRRTGDVPAWRP